MRHAVFISLTLVAGAMPVSADQPGNTPPSTVQFGVHRPAQSNPYGRLFEARDLLKQAQQAPGNRDVPKKKTVCGMTIIEADPFFDQRMRVAPPIDPKVRYTIRAVDPPICK